MYGENYIEKSLSMIKGGPYNIEYVSDKLCDQICADYGIEKTDDLKDKIEELLNEYRKNNINESTFVRNISNIVDNTIIESNEQYVEDQQSGNYAATTAYTYNTNATYDICPEDIGSIASICSGISGLLKGAEITAPALVAKYATTLIAAAKGIRSVSTCLGDFNTIINNIIKDAEENDVDYDGNMTWEQMMEWFSDEPSRMVEADEQFFIDGGCTIIDTSDNKQDPVEFEWKDAEGNTHTYTLTFPVKINWTGKTGTPQSTEIKKGRYAILPVDDKICFYNLSTHYFYVEGYKPSKGAGQNAQPLNGTIFLPSGSTDYSKLNTYTFFAEYNPTTPDGKHTEYIRELDSSAIGIRIYKNTGLPKNDPWDKYDEIGLMTKFVNKLAKTQLEDGPCQNIIAGDSAYGTFAMRVASKYNAKDENNERHPLYETVYCLDNAIIVTDINGSGKNKQQMSIEEVENMDGLNVYFCNAAGDQNLYKNKDHNNFSDDKDNCAYDESYTYTGLVYLLETCPNVKAYMLYPENAPNAASEMSVYKDLQNSPIAKNADGTQRYVYNTEWIEDFVGHDATHKYYESHTDGTLLVADFIKFSRTTKGVDPQII